MRGFPSKREYNESQWIENETKKAELDKYTLKSNRSNFESNSRRETKIIGLIIGILILSAIVWALIRFTTNNY